MNLYERRTHKLGYGEDRVVTRIGGPHHLSFRSIRSTTMSVCPCPVTRVNGVTGRSGPGIL